MQPELTTRRQLFDYLEEQMNASYRQVLGSSRLDYESNYLKTYLLELDADAMGARGLSAEALRDLFTVPPTRSHGEVRPTVRETDEAGFLTVEWGTSPPLLLYVDAVTDERSRFIITHTLSDAAATDSVLGRIVNRKAHVDQTWFWPAFLEETQSYGDFRGMGVHYDRRRFERAAGVADPDDHFAMQLSGGRVTREVYSFLRDHDEIGPRTVVDKVKLKYWADRNQAGEFALEDIYLSGKFTARGTSFASHMDLVTRSIARYAETVDRLEAEHRIRYVPTEGGGVEVAGSPVYFVLAPGGEIQDVAAFCQVVFDGHRPFRLWGVPRELPGETQALQVDATDLHTGASLYFEIYPDAIAMYLYEGACGNTVLRFYANLQHTIGRRATMERDNGARIA